MNIAHPIYLLALIVIIVPVLIFILGRKTNLVIAFPALEILRRIKKKRAWIEQLKRIIIMLLRVAAVVLIVLAIAGLRSKEQSKQHAGSSQAYAIILDASMSMQYELDGRKLAERAVEIARQQIMNLPTQAVAVVMIAGKDVRHYPEQPSASRSLLLAGLEKYTANEPIFFVQKALERVDHLYKTWDASQVQVIIISDLSRNNFEQPWSSMASIQLIDVANRDKPLVALPNMSIEDVTVASKATKQTVVFTAHNYGAVTKRCKVQGVLNEKPISMVQVEVPPQATVKKEFSLPPQKAGQYAGMVELVDCDGYKQDDAFPFHVQVGKQLKVLVVNGEHRASLYQDELFYLERALKQTPLDLEALQLTTVLPGEVTQHHLKDYHVVILANVASPSFELASWLQQSVRQGLGLLITMGPQVIPQEYNERLGELLPRQLRDFHSLKLPNSTLGASLGVGLIAWQHPLFNGEDRNIAYSLQTAKIHTFMNVSGKNSQQEDTVLQLQNNAPLLLEKQYGQGRVMLLTSSIDRDFGDLSIRSSFVPLVHKIVRYLGKSEQQAAIANVVQYQPMQFTVGSPLTMVITNPLGKIYEQVVARDKPFTHTDSIGFYQAKSRDTSKIKRQYNFLVIPDKRESDFWPFLLQEQNSENTLITYGDLGANRAAANQNNWVGWLLIIAIFLLGIELWLAR